MASTSGKKTDRKSSSRAKRKSKNAGGSQKIDGANRDDKRGGERGSRPNGKRNRPERPGPDTNTGFII